VNWKVAPEVLNWVAMMMIHTRSATENSSAVSLASRAGASATMIAPSSGMPPATVSHGVPLFAAATLSPRKFI
jgi:hypothetical protein